MHLRPATFDDAKILFIWRNNEETRKHSLHDKEVSWENHLAWLKESLSSSNRTLYLAEKKGKLLGTIRADKKEEGIELSWTVAPEARGHGYGKTMVLQFVREVFPHEKIIATVEENHVASKKIAEALGLHPAELVTDEKNTRSFRVWR
jgi:RimJ/RimL family protein N-acetyltransferase